MLGSVSLLEILEKGQRRPILLENFRAAFGTPTRKGKSILKTLSDLRAQLDRLPRPNDPDISVRDKWRYWSGHFYRAYVSKPNPVEGVLEKHRDLGSRMIRASQKNILRKMKRSGRNYVNHFEPVLEIDSSQIRDEDIHELCQFQVPFVVRGHIKNWRAVREFSPRFFSENYGDVQIPVNRGEKKPDSDKSKPTDYRSYYDMKYRTVRDLIESVESGGQLQALSVEDLLHRDNDYLIREYLRLDKVKIWSGYNATSNYFHKKLRAGLPGSLQLFIASTQGYTTWHCAPAHNFFLQLYGKKYWTFVDTAYSVGMSAITKNSHQYQGSLVDSRESNEDCASRGFEVYPYLPKTHVTLEPGDLLFNPQYCWHSVRTAGSEPTIGIGVRTVAHPKPYSPAFQLVRLLDWESYRIIKASANQGRLRDDDIVNRIFEYVDKDNRLNSEGVVRE